MNRNQKSEFSTQHCCHSYLHPSSIFNPVCHLFSDHCHRQQRHSQEGHRMYSTTTYQCWLQPTLVLFLNFRSSGCHQGWPKLSHNLDGGQEAQGRWFPAGPKFVFTFIVNHFHVLSWVWNNTWELSSVLYTLLLSLRLLRLTFSYCPHVRMLPHSRSPTHSHLTNTHLTYRNGNCRRRRPIDRTWSPSSFTLKLPVWNILDFQVDTCTWVMLTTFALLTKKPQFASSAETRW